MSSNNELDRIYGRNSKRVSFEGTNFGNPNEDVSAGNSPPCWTLENNANTATSKRGDGGSITVAEPGDSDSSNDAITDPDGTRENAEPDQASSDGVVHREDDNNEHEHGDMDDVEDLIMQPAEEERRRRNDEHSNTPNDSSDIYPKFILVKTIRDSER